MGYCEFGWLAISGLEAAPKHVFRPSDPSKAKINAPEEPQKQGPEGGIHVQ